MLVGDYAKEIAVAVCNSISSIYTHEPMHVPVQLVTVRGTYCDLRQASELSLHKASAYPL